MKPIPLRPFIRRSLLVLTVLLIVARAPSAAAATVTLGPALTSSTSTSHEYLEDYAAWFVADFSVNPDAPDPIEITAGVSQGWWTQELTFPLAIPTLVNRDTFSIQELVRISGGDFALNNWKQEIVTPGWEWVAASIFDNNTSEEVPGLLVSLNGSTASFTFDPLAVGTDIFIVKQLQYTGAGGAASPLTVHVSAIPEPASATLGLLGVSVLFFRKRRA